MMKPLNSPQILLQRDYTDMSEWASEVGWDLEYHQIEAGTVQGSAVAFGTERCFATRGRISRSFRQSGTAPNQMITIGLPDKDVEDFRWCSTAASGGDALNFSLANGFSGVLPSNFKGFAISFSKELLNEVAEIEHIDYNVFDKLQEHAVWASANIVTDPLRQQLSCALLNSFYRDGPAAAEFFNFEAASLILKFVSGTENYESSTSHTQRRAATNRAIAWIHRHEKAPITVSEASIAAGASTATLYRGFQEETGLSPKQYILTRRLSGARKDLLSANQLDQVTNIATRWGYYHLSQFSQDYKKHFGELPSQTLNRKLQ